MKNAIYLEIIQIDQIYDVFLSTNSKKKKKEEEKNMIT